MILWSGELLSSMGTGLSGFAMGVYVYQLTGSTTQFALVAAFSRVPSILLSPFAGAIADRWDRRRVMLAANAVSALTIGLLALSGYLHTPDPWEIYAAVAVIAMAGAFRDPAYYAGVSQLVPREQLGRASGLVQTGENIGMVAPPVVAGLLIVGIGLPGVLIVDAATYVLGFAAAFVVHLPAVQREETGEKAPSLWQDTVAGWRYISARRGLLYLAINGAVVSFSIGMTQIVITPLILSIAGAETLGAIFSVGGVAMLIGGLIMSAWGGPKRQVRSVLWFGLAQSAALLIIGARPNVFIIGAGIFCLLASIQFVLGSSSAIIRAHVPHEMQARVFALSRFVAWSTLPFAYFAAGPLASGVFEPLLRSDGALAGSVGRLIGTGPGRGIAFMLIVLAVVFAVAVLLMYANPALRHVEDDPTAAPAEPADGAAASEDTPTDKEPAGTGAATGAVHSAKEST